MQYDIRQEAGDEFAALGHLIAEMTPEIVPHVEEVTALPLPKVLTIRIVTVEEWMRLWARNDEQLLASEVEALSPTGEEIEQARSFLLAKREAHRGMAVGAQTVTYDEYASVVVLADNLRDAGHFNGGTWSTAYMRTVLAHELTHVGQDTAGGAGYRLLTATPFPKRRPLTDRNWTFAGEGHATWADELITARMGGGPQTLSRPAHGRVSPSRWSSGEMPTRVLDHVRAAGSSGLLGSEQHRQSLRWYAESGRAVGEVIAACGVQALNRIWTQHDLLPTLAEERDPLVWQRRLTGLPPPLPAAPATSPPGSSPAPVPGASSSP